MKQDRRPFALGAILHTLTVPSKKLTSPLERRQARLLASLLIIVIPLGTISGVLQLIFIEGFLPTFLAIAGGLTVLSVAYGLSRTPSYRVGAVITSVIPSLASYGSLVSNPADVTAFSFLLIGVLLTSILLNYSATIMIASLNVAGILFLPLLNSEWTYEEIVGPLSFTAIISLLILVFLRHRDLVERDRQAVLQKSEKKYRGLVTNSRDTIYLSDANGFITDINEAGLALLGYDVQAIVGLNEQKLFKDPADYDRLREQLAAEHVVPNFEALLLHKDGHLIDCLITASARRYEADGEEGCQVVIHDVTEWKKLQLQALEAKRIETELEKEREIRHHKDRFVSMFSHEFRNPLSVIRISASMLKNHYDQLDKAKRDKHFNSIEANLEQLNSMVEDILLLSKGDLNLVTFKPEPTDIRQLCDGVVEQVSNVYPNRAIASKVISKQLLIYLDRKMVKHVLVNLLGNALKYSPDHTPVHCRVYVNENQVVFEIRDEGIGIPDEDRPYIFDLFYRAENAKQQRGTGLGLAIVQQFVESHDGTISVESEVGKGTTFTVALPNVNRR